ncbi:uncharacterized protein PHALS_11789 [Plasmopara halstedii]|uniref:Uncharacterized protein n=1 Tax=Plasmopara halstedii TaxID=4781 RepID=A0A0P1AJM5_PLAHL|nr:uncharacterized protein PHALS_11789 [Plasmopara halstedii]CEG41442.1 hypothetical protein PHALS_11789 [Plasmopara halstedii]|eukprot:XP_024577811.1 hypothetical protein PHALS_11789 [Plasmopara halstedii]
MSLSEKRIVNTPTLTERRKAKRLEKEAQAAPTSFLQDLQSMSPNITLDSVATPRREAHSSIHLMTIFLDLA